ncbi:hypothetical protein RF11_00870 [Thelohanellus kitauei]|uniref:Uncharacterized protein n=1 Tax=Thelohanellus kitauei TaxID=669202 RepID=A0A0C2NA29_THEKT|nr:hypothetical protein RF11_00870 [Thelohanellus kitauei]
MEKRTVLVKMKIMGKKCEHFACNPKCNNSNCLVGNRCSKECFKGWSAEYCNDISTSYGNPCFSGSSSDSIGQTPKKYHVPRRDAAMPIIRTFTKLFRIYMLNDIQTNLYLAQQYNSNDDAINSYCLAENDTEYTCLVPYEVFGSNSGYFNRTTQYTNANKPKTERLILDAIPNPPHTKGDVSSRNLVK